MEQDSPVSRVERTLWTVWSYLTSVVNRFLRPETANDISDDKQQGSSANSEPADSGIADSGIADSGLAEGEARGRVVDEEQLFAKASLLSSSRPVVAWELCTTEVDSGPHEASGKSRASVEGEETRGEQIIQTEEDADAGLLNVKDERASDDGEGVNRDQEPDSLGQDEKPKNDECDEHVDTGAVRLTDEAISEDKEESRRKSSIEEETVTMIPCDYQKIGDAVTEIHVDEENVEMDLEDEEHLEVDDTEVKTVLSPEEEEEEDRMERNEEDTGLKYEEEGVWELSSEKHEDESKGGQKVEVQLSVSEEPEDDRDFKEDPGVTSVQIYTVSDDELIDADEERVQSIEEHSRVTQEDVDKHGEGVLELSSEKHEYASEEEQNKDEVKLSACKESPDDDRDVKEHLGLTTLHVESEMAYDKSDTLSDDELIDADEQWTQGIEEDTRVIQEDGEHGEGVLELSSEKHESESEEGQKDEQVEFSVCMELSDKDRDFKEDQGFTSMHIESDMANSKSDTLSDDELIDADEERMQRSEEDTRMTHEEVENGEGVLELSEKVSEVEQKDDEVQFSVCEKLLDVDRDFEEDPSFTSLHVELETAYDKSDTELIDAGQVHLTSHRSDLEEGLDVEMIEEMEQGAERGIEAANIYWTEEVVEVEHKPDAEQGEEEDILSKSVTCVDEIEQKAVTELRFAEFSDGGKKDVAEDLEVQDGTRGTGEVETESLVTVMDENVGVSVNDMIEEVEEKESDTEIACTTTSVTVNLEGEAMQEDRGESGTAPQETCEGRPVVLLQRSSPTCEETQGGVPGYNNEPQLDENTIQKFLEVGDSTGTKTSRLPEEVESKEMERLENRDQGTGGDYISWGEHMEEEHKSTEDFQNSFGFAKLSQETEKPAVVEESGLLFAEEEGNVLFDSMKTGIEHPVKEFEFGCSTDETTNELRDDGKELLIEFETSKMLLDFEGNQERKVVLPEQEAVPDETLKFLESQMQETTEASFFQELLDADLEQNNDRTPSLLEDITSFGFLQQSDLTERTFLVESTEEMQDAGISVEGTGYEVEEDTAEDAMQNQEKTEIMNLTEAEIEDKLIAVGNENENILVAECEAEHQQTAEESMTTEPQPRQDFSPEFVKTSADSISESQDVIEEEILDLWIETLSEEEEKQQERHECGQQMEAEMEKSNEEQGEMSLVQIGKHTEQLQEVNTVESELVSDTEMSLSTAESGFSDQSLSENSETQLLKSTSSGSIQGLCDMTTNVPGLEEVSAHKHESGSQDMSMEIMVGAVQSFSKEEKLVTEEMFLPDSRETEWLKQASEQSQEENWNRFLEEIPAEVERKGAEEENVKTLIETSALFEDEKIKVEEEQDFSGKIQHTEQVARSRSGSEASLEEENLSTGSDSKGGMSIEPEEILLKLPSLEKLQPVWSEDIGDSLLGLKRAKVDTTALDLTAQKSRIAVKNPRIRRPKDPRSLLHMPSVDPTPPASHPPARLPAGVPLGGMGIGMKLPGLGAGFPVLKKTRQVVRDEESADTQSQEPETKAEEKSETVQQDEAQHKPKWMPPRHPGFGNPLMSELKNKLKKTTKE